MIETLRNIAEVAITIVGFSALITLFQEKKVNWEDEDKLNLIRFYYMIDFGVLLIIFCYMPILLSNYFGLDIACRIALILFGFTTIVYYWFTAKRHKRIMGKKMKGNITLIFRLIAIFGVCFSFVVALGYIGSKYQANYLVIILGLLSSALTFFVRLIYFTVKPSQF